LKESHWPVFPEDKIQLQLCSAPMEKCRSTFEKFYKESKSERRVRWLFNHGEVEIDTQYKPQEKKSSSKKSSSKSKTTKKTTKSTIKFTVSPIQSQLLSLFNQKKEWTPLEMCQVLFPTGAQIKEDDVLSNIFSSITPLIFDPKGPITLVLTEEDKKKLEETKEKEEPKEPKEGEKKKKSSKKKKKEP